MTESHPCACGRDGCVVERRDSETRDNWRKRRYSNDSCVAEGRRQKAKAQARNAEHGKGGGAGQSDVEYAAMLRRNCREFQDALKREHPPGLHELRHAHLGVEVRFGNGLA